MRPTFGSKASGVTCIGPLILKVPQSTSFFLLSATGKQPNFLFRRALRHGARQPRVINTDLAPTYPVAIASLQRSGVLHRRIRHRPAETRHARVRRHARRDHRLADEGSRLRRFRTRTAAEADGSGSSPRDRHRAGLASRPLGTITAGSGLYAGRAESSRRWFRVVDRGAGSDYAHWSSHGRSAVRIRRLRARNPAGTCPRRHRACTTEWQATGRRPATAAAKTTEIRKLYRAGISKAEIARRLQIGRTSVRRILDTKR